MIGNLRKRWTRQRATLVVTIALLGSVATIGAARLVSHPPAIPTVEVKFGDFIDTLQVRAEVKALRSIGISAPAEVGDLQIIKIASDGSEVKKGDVLVDFDKTKTQQDLAKFESALKAAQAEIDQARAQARLTEEQDVTALMKARYDVETAKLEASKQEIVSKIEGEEAKLKLADAQQKLREAEQKQKADDALNTAAIQSKVEARQKAQFDVERTKRNLEQLTLRAPAAGTITLAQLWRPDGQAPFKPGDRPWPGAPLAELPDASTLRVHARVDETERGRLQVGEPVTLVLDAIPDRQFTGRITTISTIATMDFSAGWPFPRNFDLEVTVDQSDPRLRPGMNAQLTVVVDRVANALTIPAQASFQLSGRTVAYVLHGSKFEERAIDVGRRSGDRVLVAKGLRAGEKIALKDPTLKE